MRTAFNPLQASRLRRRFALVALGGISTAVASVTFAGSGVAATAVAASPTSIADHETVQVVADSTGKVTASRLLNQLEVTGDGHFVIVEPTATDGLRNLNGFSLPKVSDGKAIWDLSVHGKAQRRTVANLPEEKLPLTVHASYTLDGQPIAAKDIVGKSGLLNATYVVSNVSATPETITYRDGKGHLRYAIANVVMPIVGQLMTTLPSSFRDVQAKFGTLAADGHGGTITSWQLVMFPPLGQASQTLSYTAQLDHASLPEVAVQAIPVAPNATRGTRYGESRIKSGANAARQATQGGVQLDGGLVKLADGAGQLLDGLNQLYSGAAQLTDGLANQAAPGAHKLADGIGSASVGGTDLANGLGKLDTGTKKLNAGIAAGVPGAKQLAAGAAQVGTGAQSLSDGATQLSDGTSAAAAGSAALVAGLQQITSGLGLLADSGSGLPAALSAAQQLQLGVSALLAGLGDAATSGTVLNGLAQLSGGLTQTAGGLSGLGDATTGLPAAKAGVDQVATGLSGAASTSIPALQTALGQAQGVVTTLLGQVLDLTQLGELNALSTALGQVNTGLGQLLTATQQAVVGLQTVSSGLGSAVTGVTQLQTGVGQLQTGAAQLISGVTQVKLGLASGSQASPGIAEGLAQLVGGLTSAVGGVASLNTGLGTQALPGAQSLDAALGQIADGAGQLATGAGQLADGASQVAGGTAQNAAGLAELMRQTGKLANGEHAAHVGAEQLSGGLAQLLTGGDQLASGLTDAADGAGQLTAGLKQAKAGPKKLAGGLSTMRKQGAQTLITAGNANAVKYGKEYGVLKALDAKAANGGLLYDPPAGATGAVAYSYTLAAASHDKSDNAKRGAAAIALLVLTSFVGTLLRRRILTSP
jgi:putative membrane protein